MKAVFCQVIIVVLSCIMLSSCDQQGRWNPFTEKNEAFDPIDTETVLEDRSSWQKPEAVIHQMGDISEKKIADIGSGTGYFTYRFAMKGADVIAIDIDPEMISLVKLFKENLPENISDKITTRLAEPDDPKLADNEADYIFISNTIAYIQPLVDYLKLIRNGLADGGKLVIVDYKMDVFEDYIPPVDERITLESAVMNIKSAGYKITEINTDLLKYQYMIIAEL